MDRTEDSFFVTIGSLCPNRPQNTGNEFICDLPSELFLNPFDNYQIALIRFMCDTPAIPSGATQGKEVLLVEMDNVMPMAGGRPLVGLTHVLPEIVPYTELWREFYQCSSVMVLEPLHKLFFPLKSTQFSSIGIKLFDRLLRPFYTSDQVVAACTAVFQVKKMTDFAAQERVPLFLSSQKTEAHPDNTVASFKVEIPPRFQSRTTKPWYIALTGITYTPQFSLFPTNLNPIQSVVLRRNLNEDFNTLANLFETDSVASGSGARTGGGGGVGGTYTVDEETGDVTWPLRIAWLPEPRNKRDLMIALKKVLNPDEEETGLNFDIEIDVSTGGFDADLLKSQGGVMFRFVTDYPGAEVEMNYFLATILGLTAYDPMKKINDVVKIECNRIFVRQNKFDNWFEPKKMFVYANFVEPCINGPIYSRLLDVVPVDYTDRRDYLIQYKTYSPIQLAYKKFDPALLTECEISIRDDMGNLVAFKYPEQALTFLSLLIVANK